MRGAGEDFIEGGAREIAGEYGAAGGKEQEAGRSFGLAAGEGMDFIERSDLWGHSSVG